MPIEDRLEKRTVTLLEDVKISYFYGGEADAAPLVLLHGGGTDHAMMSWRDTIPALLEAGYRIYAPSYPGYGDSPAHSQPSTMETLTGYLEALMDHWGLAQAVLIGVSMGGALSLAYALAHPERVSRLVLVASYGLQDKAPFHRISYLIMQMPGLTDLLWGLSRGSHWAARNSLRSIIRNPQSRTESLVDEVFEAMQNPHSRHAFGQWQRDELGPKDMKSNYMGRLSEIEVPVLMIHGTQDLLVPVKYAQQAVSGFKDARLEIIENAGHWTQRDYPERVNKLLLDFLSEN